MLDFVDGSLYSLFEFFFGFNSVSNSLPQFLEAGRVDEQEVALETRLVDVNGSCDIAFNYRDST